MSSRTKFFVVFGLIAAAAISWLLHDDPGSGDSQTQRATVAGGQTGLIVDAEAPAVGADPGDRSSESEGRPAAAPSDAIHDEVPHFNQDQEIPLIYTDDRTDPQAVLDELGIDRDYWAWMRSRGYQFGNPTMTAYGSLGEDELRRLADDEDDEIALYVLANRLWSNKEPIEAHDRFRELVDRGYVSPMSRMARNLQHAYQWMDYRGGEGQPAATTYVMKNGVTEIETVPPWPPEVRAALEDMQASGLDPDTEVTAWLLLAETYMGQPRGELLEAGYRREEAPPDFEAVREACNRAVVLRAELEAAWQSRGIDGPSIEAAPLVGPQQPPGSVYVEACPGNRLPTADFSRCRPYMLDSTVYFETCAENQPPTADHFGCRTYTDLLSTRQERRACPED